MAIKWQFDSITFLKGYTGPLLVAANAENDTAQNNVILVGAAYDISKSMNNGLIRVRMAMTPEEALDLANSLFVLSKAAMAKR